METAPLFLCEVTAYLPSLGTTTVLRYSFGNGYTTGSGATPASTYYDARIKNAVNVTRNMFSGGTTSGDSKIAIGDLVLLNGDGLLDDLQGYQFDGRSITVRRSTVFNPSYPSDFTTIFAGTMLRAEFDTGTVTIKIRDLMASLNLPLQTNRYGGTNVLPAGLDGVASDLQGKVKPLCYGSVSNIAPPCVNTSKLIYQVNDGPIQSIGAVYDKGVSLAIGNAWSLQTSGSSDLRAVDYGNGVWVIVGDNGTILRSTNGAVSWSSAATPSFSTTNIRDVIYVSTLGLFIAAGESGKLATSPDGDVWTQRTSTFSTTTIHGLASGNGSVLAVGDSGTMATSVNGIAWSAVGTSSFGSTTIFKADYGNGIWVAVGDEGKLATSSDLASWTQRTSTFGGTDGIYSVAFAGNQWLVGGQYHLSRSLDAVSWTPFIDDNQVEAFDITYAFGTFYCAAYASTPLVGYILTTPDGTVPRRNTVPFGFASVPFGIAFDGGGLIVSVGGGGEIVTSALASASYASLADLQDNTLAPAPGTYKVYAAGGYFRLGSSPVGTVTADVTQGANAAARTTGQLWTQVLTRAGYSSGQWSAADVTALDIANAAVLGGYFDSDTTFLAVLDLMAQSIGAWWGPDQSSVFRIKQFTAPSGSPVAVITASDILFDSLKILVTNDDGDGLPVYRCTVNWGQAYTVQTTDLAGGVTDARRAVVAQQWRTAVSTDSSILTSNLLSPATVEDSLLTTLVDAQAEADRRLALRKVQRDRYQLTVPMTSDFTPIDLGSVVTIIHPRFGLSVAGDTSLGALMRAIDIEPNADAGEIILTFWGRATGSRNRITSTGAYRVTSTGAYRVTSSVTP